MNDPDLVREAIQRGWSIIPIRSNKRPDIPSWKEYQQHPPSLQQIEAWRRKKPSGWAVVTGTVSGVIVIDFDGAKGLATMHKFGVSPHVRTVSGGAHWYTRHPGYHISTLAGSSKRELDRLLPGVDIRGDGGYANFIGTTQHGRYEWLRPMQPDEWAGPLISALTSVIDKDPRSASAASVSMPPPAAENGERVSADRLLEQALGRVRSGTGRNEAGFWLSAQLRDNRYSESEAAGCLQRYSAMVPRTNTKGLKELYTQAEAMASVRQAYSVPPREPWASRHANGQPASPVMVPESEPEPAAQDAPGNSESLAEPQKKKRRFSTGRFITGPAGVFHVDKESGSKVWICSHLKIEASSRDVSSESWGRLLSWTDSAGRVHQWCMPMELTAGDGTALREFLLNRGLHISTGPEARRLLMLYIASEEPDRAVICAPTTGWHQQGQQQIYLFPDATIPPDAGVIYQTSAPIEHFFRTAGTLSEWRDHIGRRCAGNSRLVLAVSMAFAAPMLRPMAVDGGGMHLTGVSSTGKSTAQWVAGSVAGGGNGSHGFARSWRFTQNALEAVAELHNDGLLILDELREVPEPRDLDSIIYMLSNGSGKGRMNAKMTAQRTHHWQLMILSSGEIKIAEYTAAAGGARIKGGAEVRMMNLPADAGKGIGIFEDLHGSPSARLFADELKTAAGRTYGNALRAFIDHLARNWKECCAMAAAFMEKFVEKELPEGAAPEVGRALRRVALIAAAGEIASAAGITGWEKDEAGKAAARCFHDWITDRGGAGEADTEAGLRRVREFLAVNGSGRFQSLAVRMERLSDGSEAPVRVREERLPNRAGFFKDEDGGRVYLVFPDVFRNEICAGYNWKVVLNKLDELKLLAGSEGRNKAGKYVIPGEGRVRLYGIKSGILDSREEDEVW